MPKKTFILVTLLVLITLTLVSCKRVYFHLREEVHNNRAMKFKTAESYYALGQEISLTRGTFRIEYGDQALLHIVGKARITGVGEEGVATLDFNETARFYIALPLDFEIGGRYDTKHNAICEIINSFAYKSGETLFTCQEGIVVIDSLAHNKYYGTFSGDYINTSNKRLSVEGNFKAGRK